MSVPETNALSPAPRSTSTRTRSSCSTCSQQAYRPSYMAHVSALRAWGRLNVSSATAPRRSYNSSSVSGTNSACSIVAIGESLTRVQGCLGWLADGGDQGELEGQRWGVEDDAGIHDVVGV